MLRPYSRLPSRIRVLEWAASAAGWDRKLASRDIILLVVGKCCAIGRLRQLEEEHQIADCVISYECNHTNAEQHHENAPYHILTAQSPPMPMPVHTMSFVYPTTAFMLRLSKKPLKSSFFTSTTQCSKLSSLTRALVSSTTS